MTKLPAKLKRMFVSFLAVVTLASALSGACTVISYGAPAWPELPGEVQAEAAVLMDANSGCMLYGKNIHKHLYPASITKLLTALIVIENCDLDEELTFSHRAVYDVESGSSNAGYDEGDVVTVRTALYALLLASANEAANALAEHTAGSIEAFVDMMNERAAEIGCTDTHFANPSGLNDENHYTSAYDYALICREAYSNDTLVQIDSTTYITLPANAKNLEPFEIYAHHSMLKKSNPLYYDGIIGGKTGYTSKAGNTLVTCAQRSNLRLITVILNAPKTHYEDTKLLLDWGFESFKTAKLADYNTKYHAVFRSMDITGTGVKNADVLSVYDGGTITLPKDSSITDADTEVIYEVDRFAPENAVATIRYTYNDRGIGNSFLIRKMDLTETNIVIRTEEVIEAEEEAAMTGEEKVIHRIKKFIDSKPLWLVFLIALGIILVITGIIVLIVVLVNKKKKRRSEFRLSAEKKY